jgi:hypothetical protein
VAQGSESAEFATPFVMSQHGGTWTRPRKIPGLANAGPDGYAVPLAAWCASPGTCTVAGNSNNDAAQSLGGGDQPFAVSQVGGTWATPREITAPVRYPAQLTGLACAVGQCTAVGYYTRDQGNQAFTISQGR